MTKVYPLLRRTAKLTRNRLLKLMGEGEWCWPVRHLRPRGKRIANKAERAKARRDTGRQ